MNTSGDYDNPWESAVNDRSYVASTTSTPAGPETPSAVASTPPSAGSSSPPRSFAYRAVQTCHVLDLLMAALLTIYAGLILWKTHHSVAVGGLVLASVWVFRSLLATTTPCGIAWSAQLSLVCAILYLITAAVAALVAHFKHSSLLPLPWSQEHLHRLPWLLLGFAVAEALRWASFQQWLAQEQEDEDIAALERHNYSPFRRHRQQPWWWARQSHNQQPLDSPGTQPLLSDGQPNWTSANNNRYSMDEGVTSSSWWPFPTPRSRRRRNNNDSRDDDDSVEYASLNEEWASRSEQDPFWWTQEESATTPTHGG